MGIKSKTHFQTPNNLRSWKCAWLEQATRVELAGNSLGSCRHTARRHLHCLRRNGLSASTLLIIYPFQQNVNGFSPPFALFFSTKYSAAQPLSFAYVRNPYARPVLALHSLQVPKNSTLYPSTKNPLHAFTESPLEGNPSAATSATLPHVKHLA